jgi:GTPase SAR1 family protein
MTFMARRQQTTQLDQSQKIRLGIWGPPSSGKTVYMTMLSHYLRVAESSPWKVEITDESTIEFVTQNLSLIRTKGEFMGGTEIRRDESPKVYSYKLKHKNKMAKDVELNFFDLPGRFYLGGDQYGIADESGRTLSVAQYLNQCHGILFLLSPLDEDRSSLEGASYYDLLEKLFMNMQSTRQSMSPELEQYVAFCITKVDHPEVYDRFCRSTATKSLLKLLGDNVSLNWFQNFFHVDINSKKQELTPEPSQYNRCQFFYISPFGVYRDEVNNTTQSPVFVKSTEDKLTPPKTSRNPDPIFQNSNSKADPYENIPVGIPSYDDWGEKNSKIYQIDTEVKFSPINVLSPIQWLIKGIEHHHPALSPLATMAEEENQDEEK